jgi:hypothetical protein
MSIRTQLICLSVALASAVSIGASNVAAQPGPGANRPRPAMNIRCPNPTTVSMAPVGAPGWSTNTTPVHLALDPLNPPRAESNTLICYYALGNQPGAFVLFRSANGQSCSATSDHKGFVCVAP